MTEATDALALAIVGAGILVGLTIIATDLWQEGLKAGMLLWVAAGLIRLGFEPNYHRLMAAAAIILTRRLVVYGLRASPIWVRKQDAA